MPLDFQRVRTSQHVFLLWCVVNHLVWGLLRTFLIFPNKLSSAIKVCQAITLVSDYHIKTITETQTYIGACVIFHFISFHSTLSH